MLRPILGITMGDAAGVGPEVIVKALADVEIYRIARPLVYGDAKMMERAVHIVGAKVHCHAVERPADGHYEEGTIDVVDLANLPADLPFAQVDGRAGRAAYEYIERACADAMHRSIHAIVTAPLNKEALHLGGLNYPGHTEILGSLMGQTKYSMMLTSPKLRVIHVTTHIALHDVPGRVKKERIADVIALAQETLQLMGIERPRIAVAGPPDSVFHRAANLGEFDIVVVMYHDQGHIPIKVLGFDSGVNVTVGLPCIRTSVDHGTAFPVAGTGKASENSMCEALKLAAQMAKVKFAAELAN